ncbi:response regulator [Heyndrickxia coagulans]|uniref:Response regulator n=2 Tax=Heyndrickxia coagulans TaxID=1398 RepID=A0AAW7CFU0_HEYCO|nr:response regulator [Heyndrickxia coagulans]MDL5039699.1 response regulator [Heyndrickxia coagulans]
MKTIKAVIAEDDFRVALVHEKFLAEFPCFEVVGKALNAKETLALVEEKSPDFLLLDVYFPDRIGVDLLPDLRALSPHLDIMMITAAVEKDFIEKALHYGVEHYLIKPVSLKQFKEAVEKYLDKKRLLETAGTVDQAWVDSLFGSPRREAGTQETELPKGIDAITLSKVKAVLIPDQGQSAEQVAEKIGASRTTARRYLEYLVSIRTCRAEVEYGIVGRPERKYYLVSSV